MKQPDSKAFDEYIASGESRGIHLSDLVPFRRYDHLTIPDNDYPPADTEARFPRGSRVETLDGYMIKAGLKARVVFSEKYNGYNRYYILIDGMDKQAQPAKHRHIKLISEDDGTNKSRVRDYDYLYHALDLVPDAVTA